MKFDFGNAFKIPKPPPITEEQTALLEKVSAKLREKGLATAAAISIESTKPVHYTGSQAMYFILPMVEMLVKPEDARNFRDIMQNPAAMDRFADMLYGVDSDKK